MNDPSHATPIFSAGASRPAPGVNLRALRLLYEGAPLFDGIDLALAPGRWTCLLGPSGVGKSSLLRFAAGLLPDAEGSAVDDEGNALQGRIALMAQQDLLLPWLSALDNTMLGARLRGEARPRVEAEALLARLGLGGQTHLRPAALSGGMRQRTALARTLMENRPIVLMDEPFSGLDAITRLRLQTLAAEALAGRTVLLVTHDPLEALRLGHRLIVMTGRPARLSPPIEPPGAPPRDVADPEVLRLQGQLLRQLGGGES